MQHAARAMVAFAVVAFVVAVAVPAGALLGLLRLGGEVPATFDGARTLVTTLGWSIACAAAACALGWPVGRAMRSARGGHVLRALSVVAAALPAYAVFWTWWQAAGPGSAVGDWCAATGRTGMLREALLFVGIASWSWPLAAWIVAARRADGESAEREAGSIDAERGRDRLARAWRSDRGAVGIAFAALVAVVAGSTVAFDLAQVPTFGFELRALDVQGTPASAVVRAAWPAIALALLAGVAFAAVPVRPRPDGDAAPRTARSPAAWLVVSVTLLVPLATLAAALLSRGALDRFGAIGLRGAAGTLLAAAAAGAVLAAVAAGHLLLAARGCGAGSGAAVARIAERSMLIGWAASAAIPATVAALATIAAWNVEGLGRAVYDGPAIVVLSHVGRFGIVAAWLGRIAALREPAERRDLRAVDGQGLGGALAALAPDLRACAISAGLVGTVLAAGEVIAAARLEPPGWAWSSSMLLNAIHYQQPATVLGGLLALVVLASCAGGAVSWALARGERTRGIAMVLLVAVVLVGCRESAPSGGPRLEAERWFGSPGRGRGQFEYPRALDIDPRDGTLVVVDRQARLQRFDRDGRYLGEWAMPEKALGKPTGLGIGPDGRVWVADTHYHRVICWSPEGRELLRFGEYGTGPGQFIFPCDAEVGPDGNVWVSEFGGNDRVQVFRPDGSFVRQFGSPGRAPGQFDRPQSIAFSPDGREVFVADACNHRIQVLDLEGRPLRCFGRDSSPPVDMAFPYGLEPVGDGTLLVTEFGNHRIHRIAGTDGRDLGTAREVGGAPVPLLLHVVDGDRVRSMPSGENALRFPWAVGVRGDEAFILDSGHSRVLRLPVRALPAATAPASPVG